MTTLQFPTNQTNTKMEATTIIFSALLLLAASIFSYFHISTTSKSRTPPLPPGPRGLPIVGYLPFLDVNLHHQLTKLGHKHGPIYSLKLGSKLYIVVSSPALVKAVVRDHDAVFANRDPPAAAMAAHGGMDIFWSPNGAYWRDMRKLFVREMLSNKNLEGSYELRVGEVNKFVADLRGKIGEAVEIGELVFGIEVGVLMSMLWGGTVRGEERDRIGAEFRVKVSKFVDLLGRPNVSDFFPFLGRFDLQGIEREMKGVVPKIEELIDVIIDEKMKVMKSGDERKKDLLEVLLELKGQRVGEESSFGLFQIKAVLMPLSHLRSQGAVTDGTSFLLLKKIYSSVGGLKPTQAPPLDPPLDRIPPIIGPHAQIKNDIIIGGTDTTATTVEWVLAELLNNPDIMQKVQHEVEHVVGTNNSVEESHLPKLRYLDAVVKETMRLHPPLPLIVPRLPTESTMIGGYTIPKGTRVFMNMWSIYMDPQLWENPSKFRPERFLNENSDCDYSGNNFQYLPFGSGRRVCPGLALAERMVLYLLATLLHSFDWRLPDGESIDLSGTFGIVVRKTKPLLVVPYQRSR